MSKQRRRDTDAEMTLRRLLHARGLRYRVDRALPGMPRRRADLTFPSQRVVVFVDGCFWHGCPQHCRVPAANADYWEPKLRGNSERDRRTDHALADRGWRVLRIWEHEPLEEAVAQVLEALRC
jgi:DNA mismatch endonuclease, patch repair protein